MLSKENRNGMVRVKKGYVKRKIKKGTKNAGKRVGKGYIKGRRI